jgi:DNA polymerase III subunit gamma/tau
MLDIIEIDGASNNGVSNVRELIERARFQPSMGTYKAYIIDEVHMLSSGAFNALLKILEEPPSHVKFILATTESHKIPDTIISRSQRYDFRKISEVDIISRLQFVATQESIEADPTALSLVAKLARWGLRDALSLFEQYSIGGVLSYDFMMENLSLLGDDFLQALIQSVFSRDIDGVVQSIEMLRARSIDPRRFTEELLGYLRTRSLTLARTAEFAPLWLIFKAVSEIYSRLKDFPDGFILVEMTLLANMTSNSEMPLSSPTHAPIVSSKRITSSSPAAQQHWLVAPEILNTAPKLSWVSASASIASEDSVLPVTKEESAKVMPTKSAIESSGNTSEFSYPRLVDLVKNTPKKWVLLNTLKTGAFKYSENPAVFTLISRTEFDRSKLDNAETRDFLATAIESLFGVRAQIDFAVSATVSTPSKAPERATSSHLSEIF